MRQGIIAVLCLASSVAIAADDPRKINFTTILLDQDNAPITECIDSPAPKDFADCKSKQPVTLGVISMRALVAGEQGLAQDESLKRGQLALSVYKANAVQLPAEDIALIKKQIAKNYSPLMVLRTFQILDPATGVDNAK